MINGIVRLCMTCHMGKWAAERITGYPQAANEGSIPSGAAQQEGE